MSSGKNESASRKQYVGRGAVGQALSLGTNLAAGMVIFSFIGYWIDRKTGGGVFWTICGMFLGLVYGGYEVWKVIRALNEESKAQEAAKAVDRK